MFCYVAFWLKKAGVFKRETSKSWLPDYLYKACVLVAMAVKDICMVSDIRCLEQWELARRIQFVDDESNRQHYDLMVTDWEGNIWYEGKGCHPRCFLCNGLLKGGKFMDVKKLIISRFNGGLLTNKGEFMAFAHFRGLAGFPKSEKDVLDFGVGRYHLAILKNNSRVEMYGEDDEGQCRLPLEVNRVGAKAVTCGMKHTACLLVNGHVTIFGKNAHGQTLVPDGIENCMRILAFMRNTVVVSEGGYLVTVVGERKCQRRYESEILEVAVMDGVPWLCDDKGWFCHAETGEKMLAPFYSLPGPMVLNLGWDEGDVIIGRAMSGDVILRCSPVERGWEIPLTLSSLRERLSGRDDFELLQIVGDENSEETGILCSVLVKGIPWKVGMRGGLDAS